MSRPTLEDAIHAALYHHADNAHLPITPAHVRAQAATAARAAASWYALEVMRTGPSYNKPAPPSGNPPPDHPTAPGQACHRDDCDELAEGWRWYVARGWQPACRRHLTGAIQAGRRYNTQYEAGAA